MSENQPDTEPQPGAGYSWPVDTELYEVLEAEIETEYGGLSAQHTLSLSVHEYNGTVMVNANANGGDVARTSLQIDPGTADELADALHSAAAWSRQRDAEASDE